MMFSLKGKLAVQVSTTSNNSSTITNFFKDSIPHFFDGDKKRRVTCFLDNFSGQKTSEFKDLVNTMPLCLCYLVPCTSYQNLIEEFFLATKERFKKNYYYGERSMLADYLAEVRAVLLAGDFSWMLRKYAAELLGRLEVDPLLNDSTLQAACAPKIRTLEQFLDGIDPQFVKEPEEFLKSRAKARVWREDA